MSDKPVDWNDVPRQQGVDVARAAFDHGAIETETALAGAGGNSNAERRPVVLPFTLWRDLCAVSHKGWLVNGFLGAGETSAWFGAPGDGKSVLVEDLAIHVAAGLPWFGRKVKRGAVLYCALERPELVKRRAIAFRKKRDLSEDLPFAVLQGVFDFRDPQIATQIAAAAKQLSAVAGNEVVLIVIDTVSRALCGGDENSPKDMGAFVAGLGRVQEATGAHVLVIHHQPLDGDRLRGHGSLLAAVDIAVQVKKTTDRRSARITKANDAEEGQNIAFSLESVVVGVLEGEKTTAPVVVEIEGDRTSPGIGTKAARTRKLPNSATVALRALHEVLAGDDAYPAPASNYIPQGVRLVSEDRWREIAYRKGISGREGRAEQVAFQRAKECLLAEGRIGYWDGAVWLGVQTQG